MVFLPSSELEGARDQDDHGDGHRNSTRQRRHLHVELSQRNADRKRDHSENGPYKEIPDSHQRCQPSQTRLSLPDTGLTVVP